MLTSLLKRVRKPFSSLPVFGSCLPSHFIRMVRLGKSKTPVFTRHLCASGIGHQMNTTMEEVEEVFAPFGEIEDIQIPENKVLPLVSMLFFFSNFKFKCICICV